MQMQMHKQKQTYIYMHMIYIHMHHTVLYQCLYRGSSCCGLAFPDLFGPWRRRGCLFTTGFWFGLKLDWLCVSEHEGGVCLCRRSCRLFHSILYWICEGPSLWSENLRQLGSANWCCVWYSLYNASFDFCASSTRPVPSNK